MNDIFPKLLKARAAPISHCIFPKNQRFYGVMINRKDKFDTLMADLQF